MLFCQSRLMFRRAATSAVADKTAKAVLLPMMLKS